MTVELNHNNYISFKNNFKKFLEINFYFFFKSDPFDQTTSKEGTHHGNPIEWRFH